MIKECMNDNDDDDKRGILRIKEASQARERITHMIIKWW